MELVFHCVFKCHLCKDSFDDPILIGVHFRDKHNYNFISDQTLV